MKTLQHSPWFTRQTSHRASLLPSNRTDRCVSICSNTQSSCIHTNRAASLRVLASGSAVQKRQHLQHRFSPSIQSPSPIPYRRFATKTHFSETSSSPAPLAAESPPLSTERFHHLSDTYIDALVAKLEALQEEREDVDVEYSAGVLSLIFPPAGTYVLNKQPPNKQIWLSSPISGPKRYDWVATKSGGSVGKWMYLRDGSTLDGLLAEEIGITSDDI